MENYRDITRACILILGLQRRVTLRVRPGRQWVDKDVGVTCGFCDSTSVPDAHIVEVVNGALRGDANTLIAHELAHAFVAEYHPAAKDHGRTFQRTAAAMRRDLRSFGFKVEPLFIKGVDV